MIARTNQGEVFAADEIAVDKPVVDKLEALEANPTEVERYWG